MNNSALATREVLQIVFPTREKIREIMADEPEVKVCHGCGEPDTKAVCFCDIQTKVRLCISEQFTKKNFIWMSKDVLTCDDHKLNLYAMIAFFYAPSEELGKLFVKAKIFNFAECGECGNTCTPDYYYGGKEPLCRRCAREILN
jgi:hypothetical protein